MRSGPLVIFSPEAAIQLISDLTLTLSHRINELVSKGFLMFLVLAQSEHGSLSFDGIVYRALKNCESKGILSENDLLNFHYPLMVLDNAQIREVLSRFEGKIEVKLLEETKSICPFYTEFVNGGKLEDYRKKLSGTVGTLLKGAFLATLRESDEEKERLYEKFKQELEESIGNEEVSANYFTVIIQKL